LQGAFFYIEGIFYVDRRKSGGGRATDYVTPIREFCKEYGIHPPPPVKAAAEAKPRPRIDDQGDASKLPF
jgi:hypothetical protein